MLTLFPKAKTDAASAAAPASALPERAAAVTPSAPHVAETAVSAQAETPAAESAMPQSAAPSAPIEILAEISLIKPAGAEPTPALIDPQARVTASLTPEPVEAPPAPAATTTGEPLDIGEWETASASESEPLLATKPEIVFEAFSSALHAHDSYVPKSSSQPVAGSAEESLRSAEVSNAAAPEAPEPASQTAAAEPMAESVAEALSAPAEPALATSTSAPLVETPEDLLAALAIETPEEPVPAREPAAAPLSSGVDPALREALASKKTKAKGSFFVLPRIPEPEAMEDAGEVDAYCSAAAQSHLDAIDDTFVAHAELLLKGRERGRALDIGTGPGQIVLKLGYHLSRWKFVGLDRSQRMIAKANQALATAPELAGRIGFVVADGNKLDFPDHSFDLVMCNSVLHHLEDPQKLFSEMARLLKPGGALLLRDLVRPARLGFGHHVRKHGKHYSGEMKRLYVASLHAAYTEQELQRLIEASALRGHVKVFRHRNTHIGFARAVSSATKK
jgi:ubiquinone/menaquinone biosynthesis C-methylase UbiE